MRLSKNGIKFRHVSNSTEIYYQALQTLHYFGVLPSEPGPRETSASRARMLGLRCCTPATLASSTRALRCRSLLAPLARNLSDTAAAFPYAANLALAQLLRRPRPLTSPRKRTPHPSHVTPPLLRSKVSSLESIIVELDGSVATLTINRPKALNALSADVISELHTALDALETLVPCEFLTETAAF